MGVRSRLPPNADTRCAYGLWKDAPMCDIPEILEKIAAFVQVIP
jgi:hypothetical protein